jgi:ribosomal protein S18 acetylase RimI-like enzyme
MVDHHFPIMHYARSRRRIDGKIPHMSITIRRASEAEREAADRVARVAFAEYEAKYPDWIPVLRDTRPMTQLALDGELLVAEIHGAIVGTVAYLAPGRSRDDVFHADWAVLRMMAVDPAHRGHGVARALVEECARLARRDRASALALYTSPAMKAAVELYRRAGFRHQSAIAPVMGMPCEVYALQL